MTNKPATKQDFTPSKVATKTMEVYAKEYGLVPSVHFVFLGGNPYITSDGLLWLGNNHPQEEKRIAGIKTDIIQSDFKENIFVIKATVYLNSGQQFEGIGTATRENLTRITANHGLEMAETRAVSRALRKAYAIGLPAVEELQETKAKEEKQETSQAKEGTISQKQRNRLWAIANEHGVSEDEVKEIIRKYGYESTKDIHWKDYEKIIQDIENQSEKEPQV